MRLSIRKKVIGTITIVLLLTAVVGWRGIAGMRDINRELDSIHDEQFHPARMIANANIALVSWNRAILNHVLAESTEKMVEYEQIMLDQRIAMIERLEELSGMKSLSVRGMELVEELQNHFFKADPIRDRVVALSRSGAQEDARQLIRVELRAIVDHMDKDMTEFLLLQEKQLVEAKRDTDDRYEQGIRRIFTIISSVLVFSFFAAFLVLNGIMKNMNELIRGMSQTSAADFKQAKVSILSHDEFEDLGAGFNRMVDRIEQGMIEIEKAQATMLRQERLATVGKLSSNIAHEIKNPLAVIDSSAHYLKMKLKEADEKTLLHLDRIRNQVGFSTGIIQSLQNLTQLKEVKKIRVDLAAFIEEEIASSKLPRGIKVVRKIPEGQFFVAADKKQLGIVFDNILKNAVQAMDNRGTIWVTVTETSAGLCEISFKDTGPGIKAENLAKIFESLVSTRATGTGMGLAICQMIIEKHGGTMEARSKPGEGATFIVRLPSSENHRGDNHEEKSPHR